MAEAAEALLPPRLKDAFRFRDLAGTALKLGARNVVIDGTNDLTFTGSFTCGTNARTITVTNGITTIQGTITSDVTAGSLALTKAGTGTLVISSDNIIAANNLAWLLANGGGDLKLLNLTKKVHDLLQITKLYTVFDIKDDEAAAVGSFGK